jgi:hypothetical protein
MALVICFRLFWTYNSKKANASPIINTHSGTASVQTPVQTSVYYDAPAFSVVYPPGSVVQVQHTTSEDTPPLVWTYYQGKMLNDARLVVSYIDFDAQRSPLELSKQFDNSYDNMFVPGYSIKKEASRLDTLPAVSAVVYGFGQGSDTVQCHKCTRYEAHAVVAWDKDRRRLWKLQTLAEPNELSSEEAVKFLNSFKLK